jgi:DNA-binding GntR family transcriptional regulator
MALVNSLGSPRTSRMHGSLVSQVKLCMAQVQGLQLVQPVRIIKEHQHLLELIEAGDGVAAGTFLDEHLSHPRERLMTVIGGLSEQDFQDRSRSPRR